MYVLTGVSSGARSLKVNNPDIMTLRTALLERMYYCKVNGKFEAPPAASYGVINRRLKAFRSKLLRGFPKSTRISPEQFVQMYKGRKKAIYEKAMEDYYAYGVTRADSTSVAFVKCEKVPCDKAPRCIQPRKPVYNVGVGRYIKPIEHKLYSAIGRVFGDKVVVVKGFNVKETAEILREKWCSFSDPVAVGLDATKFDMHVGEYMLLWEHSVYNGIYGCRTLLKYLKWQRKNKGMGFCLDGKLKYTVDGRRFSGDMNTALGNCLIMCAMVYAYAQDRNVQIKLANNGDDCQVFMERADLARFMTGLDQWFFELGFRMTVEDPVYEFNQVEFCQMRPIRVAAGWTMVRNIPKAREKDSISIIPLDNPKVARKWMYAVGECGLALCSGVPIMQEMYKMYMREGVQSKLGESVAMETGMKMLSIGLDAKEDVVTPEAREHVFTAWGYTPDEQIAIEAHYRGMQFNLDNSWVCDNPSYLYSPNL